MKGYEASMQFSAWETSLLNYELCPRTNSPWIIQKPSDVKYLEKAYEYVDYTFQGSIIRHASVRCLLDYIKSYFSLIK